MTSDIEQWRPLVAEIGSSMAGIAQQTADTEKLCERISESMRRWETVCSDADASLSTVANYLLASVDFRACIDNVLAKMDDVRDDMMHVDLGRDVLHETADEKLARIHQLSVRLFTRCRQPQLPRQRRCFVSVVYIEPRSCRLLSVF